MTEPSMTQVAPSVSPQWPRITRRQMTSDLAHWLVTESNGYNNEESGQDWYLIHSEYDVVSGNRRVIFFHHNHGMYELQYTNPDSILVEDWVLLHLVERVEINTVMYRRVEP